MPLIFAWPGARRAPGCRCMSRRASGPDQGQRRGQDHAALRHLRHHARVRRRHRIRRPFHYLGETRAHRCAWACRMCPSAGWSSAHVRRRQPAARRPKFRRREVASRSRAKSTPCFRCCATATTQQAAALSGGRQQMLAIGRTLSARHGCAVLDEPGMGLAPQICGNLSPRGPASPRQGADRPFGRAKCQERPGRGRPGLRPRNRPGAPLQHLRRAARQPRRPPRLGREKDN